MMSAPMQVCLTSNTIGSWLNHKLFHGWNCFITHFCAGRCSPSTPFPQTHPLTLIRLLFFQFLLLCFCIQDCYLLLLSCWEQLQTLEHSLSPRFAVCHSVCGNGNLNIKYRAGSYHKRLYQVSQYDWCAVCVICGVSVHLMNAIQYSLSLALLYSQPTPNCSTMFTS